VPLGEHALRGIAAPCAVFTLPGAQAARGGSLSGASHAPTRR
jgi:hypothetical protein